MPQSFMDDALAEARAGAGCRRGAGRLRDRARRRRDRARRQPHPARPRPDRACRDAGDPAGRGRARLRAAHRLRPLRHARALRHVRGGDLVRAHPAALLRRRRSEGRRGRERRAVLCLADLPSPAGGLWRHRRERGGGAAARISSKQGAELFLHLRLDRPRRRAGSRSPGRNRACGRCRCSAAARGRARPPSASATRWCGPSRRSSRTGSPTDRARRCVSAAPPDTSIATIDIGLAAQHPNGQRIDGAAVDQHAAVELDRPHQARHRHRGRDRGLERALGEQHGLARVQIGRDHGQRDRQVGEISRAAARRGTRRRISRRRPPADCRSPRRGSPTTRPRAPPSRGAAPRRGRARA